MSEETVTSVGTYHPAEHPEMLEAVASSGERLVLFDPECSLYAHLRAVERLMDALGHRRESYCIMDGTSITDEQWMFKITMRDSRAPGKSPSP